MRSLYSLARLTVKLNARRNTTGRANLWRFGKMDLPIVTHKDKAGWGDAFVRAAAELGIKAQAYEHPDEIPPGARVFIRMSQQLKERDICQQILRAVNERQCETLPSGYAIETYDDKAKQALVLGEYMPQTWLVSDAERAVYIANNELGYPLISKAKGGASSANVRFVETPDQMKAEVEKIFNGEGWPISYGERQKDYMLLQKFISGNDCDYRIVINGRFAYGLKRYVREDKPFASGSGKNEPIVSWEGRALAALEFCHKIHEELEAEWLCYDVVFDGNDRPYLLETSCAWAKDSYRDCPALILDSKGVWIDSDYTGGDMFKFAVEIIHGEELL